MTPPGPIRTAADVRASGEHPMLPGERMKQTILGRLSRAESEGHDRTSALRSLFPHTVLDEETLGPLAAALLSGDHLLFVGPPGSGKTSLAKDVWGLYPKSVLAVEGCPVQDDPWSLVDPAFSAIVPPCPWCKVTFGGAGRKEVGDFDPSRVDPAKVPVRAIRLREGYGHARVQGSPEVFPDNLTGALNLAKLEEIGDPESPLVLEPGKVLQANRGVLFVDEIGKLPRGTQNVLLQGLQERIVTPAKTRETFPAAFLCVATSNLDDLDNIVEPLSGRLSTLSIDFLERHEDNRAILDLALRDEKAAAPTLLRDATAMLVARWRKTTDGTRDLEEVGSNRTMIDVLRRGESYALLRGDGAVGLDDFRSGALEVMRGKVKGRGGENFAENRDLVASFVDKHWRTAAREAAERYWCKFFLEALNEDKREGEALVRELRPAAAEPGRLEALLAAAPEGSRAARFARFVAREEGAEGPAIAAAVARVFAMVDRLEAFSGPKERAGT